MSVDPEEVAREEAIIEIEGKFLRAIISKHARSGLISRRTLATANWSSNCTT